VVDVVVEDVAVDVRDGVLPQLHVVNSPVPHAIIASFMPSTCPTHSEASTNSSGSTARHSVLPVSSCGCVWLGFAIDTGCGSYLRRTTLEFARAMRSAVQPHSGGNTQRQSTFTLARG
jgi:hypothetical protein